MSETNKKQPAKTSQAPAKSETVLSQKEMQARMNAMQQQVFELNKEFGEIGGVAPNGTAAQFKLDENGDVSQHELSRDEIKNLMKQIIDFEDPENKMAFGKMAYLANACAAYIVQTAILEQKQEVVDEDNFVGTPYRVLPVTAGISEEPLAQFSAFKTNDGTELSHIVQKGMERTFSETKEHEILAQAYKSLLTHAAQITVVQNSMGLSRLTEDQILFQALETKTIFLSMTRDQLFEMSMEMYHEEGARLGQHEELDALQQAVELLEQMGKGNPFLVQAPRFIIDQNGQKLDYSILPLELDQGGAYVIAADQVKKQIRKVEREELLSVLKNNEHAELLGVISCLIAMDAQRTFSKPKEWINDCYDVVIDKPQNTNTQWVTSLSEAELARKIKNITPEQIGQDSDIFQIKKSTPNLNAQIFAAFSILKDGIISEDSVFYQKVVEPLLQEVEGDNVIHSRIKGTIEGCKKNRSMAEYVMKTIGLKLMTPLDADALHELIISETDPVIKSSYESALEALIEMRQEHAEEVEEYTQRKEREEHITSTVLARGAQSEKAYETWKGIHKLPREQQAAAQLKAFAPSVANDIPEQAVTADPDHDFIELALESWKTARMAGVKDALGELSPLEEALMHYTLDAAHDSMRYIVMAELAAYDPTVIMRKEKDVYFKHLGQASSGTNKKNGGVDALNNLDSHLSRWFGWYDNQTCSNLLDMVAYDGDKGWGDSEHASYHHHYTHFFCMSDFFNNAKVQAKSNARDYVGLSGLANRLMRKDNPHRLTREIAQAIHKKDLSKLDIDQDRFDQIIALSTHVSNRPEDKGERFAGTSLLTGTYVRWRAAKDADRESVIKAAKKKAAPKP